MNKYRFIERKIFFGSINGYKHIFLIQRKRSFLFLTWWIDSYKTYDWYDNDNKNVTEVLKYKEETLELLNKLNNDNCDDEEKIIAE